MVVAISSRPLAVEDAYPVTAAQLAMLLGEIRSGRGSELQQVEVGLDPRIDVRRLRSAWEWGVSRHPVLRGRIRSIDGIATMEVVCEVEPPFSIKRVASLDSFLAEDRDSGVDVSNAPAFRVSIVEHPRGLSLVFTHHHAMLDGRSVRILLREVFNRYLGNPVDLVDSPPSFRFHCEAYRSRDRVGERNYFSTLLQGAEQCYLPFSLGVGRLPDRRRGVVGVDMTWEPLPERLEGALPDAAFIQAAWAIVLSRYCRTGDVVFGMTRSGRHLVTGGKGIVGCLVNTIPVRVRLGSHDVVSEIASRLASQSRASRAFEHASLSEVQEWLGYEEPPFNTLLMYENYVLEDELRKEFPTGLIESARMHEQSSFPVVLAVYQSGGKLRVELEYDSTKWSSESMGRLLARFTLALQQSRASRAKVVRELDLYLDGESAKLGQWAMGPGVVPLSAHQGATRLDVLGQWRSSPRTAFVDASGCHATYAELQDRADLLAYRLIASHGQVQGPVALLADRSFDSVALMVGAFARGWTLVPLDPDWPFARIQASLALVKPQYLICDRLDVLDRFGVTSQAIAESGCFFAAHYESFRRSDEWIEGRPPAYVVFTSGTSGNPKGVEVPYRALVAHANAVQDTYGIHSTDRVLQFASPAFDVAIEECVPTLMAGATLVARPHDLIEDLATFTDYLDERGVTILNLPSAMFHLVVDYLSDRRLSLPSSVRLTVIGSERPTIQSINAFFRSGTRSRLLNAYGPTEATVTCCVCDLNEVRARGELDDAPIGQPIGECIVFVLDSDARQCPVDVIGEIFVGGAQLASGYLGDPDKTASSFVSDVNGLRMYKTGDIGRIRSDGLLQILGRSDDQVKIRGVRVEPGDVEHALRGVLGVSDAVVVVRQDARGSELVAFVIRSVGAEVNGVQIKQGIAQALPQCFVPSEFRFVDSFPLRTNGKVDRGVLQVQAQLRLRSSIDVAQPQNDLESYLLSIFHQVLQRNDIGVLDSFFDSGGHSLLAIKLLGEINKVANAPLSLAAVFSGPTVRELARAVGDRCEARVPAVVPLNSKARELLSTGSGCNSDPAVATPAFFVCGVHLYAALGRALSEDRSVFGIFLEIENDVLTGLDATLGVRDMAARYVECLRSVRSKGPYIVGGVSFGGVLAYEIAQQLRRSGECVELLVLLDTILPRAYAPPGILRSLLRAVAKVVERLTGMHPRYWRFNELSRGAPSSREGSTVHEMERKRDFLFLRAADSYDREIEHYEGDAVLIRARRTCAEEQNIAWHLGWAGLLPHESAVYGVEGDHLGILSEPGASSIANILRQRLS
jgi:amino acid adenylation domain-containing protein